MSLALRSALAAMLVIALPPPAAATPKMIYVAEVAPADDAAKTALTEWGQAVASGLDPIINDIGASDPGAVTPQIFFTSVNEPPSVATLKQLSDEGQAVEVSSAVSQATSAFSVITMTVYLGALKGALPSPVLILRQKVESASFDANRDALVVVALYAWGQMSLARHPGPGKAALCGYFSQALLRGAAIQAATPDIRPVVLATRKALTDARCPHA